MEEELRTGIGAASVTITSRPDALGTRITSDCPPARARTAPDRCAVVLWRGSEMYHCAARRIAATAVPISPQTIHEVNVNIGFLQLTDCRFRRYACKAQRCVQLLSNLDAIHAAPIGAGEIMRRRRRDKVDAIPSLQARTAAEETPLAPNAAISHL
jgi:hypothetical protein